MIACAGLQSDVVARLVGADPSPKILPFRGEYWSLNPARNHLVRGMIYPVPDPRFPFLGVHFTRGVYDDVHVGPNAVPALAREGYGWLSVSAKDTWESLRWPGAGPLAKKALADGRRRDQRLTLQIGLLPQGPALHPRTHHVGPDGEDGRRECGPRPGAATGRCWTTSPWTRWGP